MESFIKLYRKSLDSVVFQNANLWQVWSYCLMRANHKTTKILFGGKEITLQAGQFISGRIQGAEDCNMNPSTYRNQLAKLRSLGNLDIKSDNKKSIITVVKWTHYQANEINKDINSDNKRTTKGHRQEYKNINKENNSKTEDEFKLTYEGHYVEQ